jgi:hypothetical protein
VIFIPGERVLFENLGIAVTHERVALAELPDAEKVVPALRARIEDELCVLVRLTFKREIRAQLNRLVARRRLIREITLDVRAGHDEHVPDTCDGGLGRGARHRGDVPRVSGVSLSEDHYGEATV